MNLQKRRLKKDYPHAWRWISLARRISGWLTDGEANALFEIARLRAPERDPVIVELGSWQGKSSILLAAGVRGKPNALVYCVDPFGVDEDPDIQAKHYSPLIDTMRHSLEEGFQRNVRRCGVGNIVRALKGYSYEVVRSWKDPIDVLFIDASHVYENVHRDFVAWSPFVKVGGIVILHDIQAAWPGPSRVMAEDLQPPQYADLEQVDSLAWAVKQPCDPGAISSTARSRVVVTRVDFEARLREIARLSEVADRLGAAEAGIARLTGELEAARSEAAARGLETARLTGELEAARSEAAARGLETARLTGELAAARSEAAARGLEIARLNGELEAARSEAAREAQGLEISRRQNDRLLAELSGVHKRVDRLLDELIHRWAETRQLAGELEERRIQVGELSTRIVGQDLEIGRLSNELSVRNIETRRLFMRVTARKSELVRLREEVRSRKEECVRLSQALAAQAATQELELAAFRNSLTWRLTQPMRRWVGWLNGLGVQGRRTIRILRSSGLFDREYYLAQNPDVAAAHLDPIRHFVKCGAAEGRDPSCLFDTSAYIQSHPELAASGMNPLLHYLLHEAADRNPNTAAEGTKSKGKSRFPRRAKAVGFAQWLLFKRQVRASGLFDERYYLEHNPDVVQRKIDPLLHFFVFGALEGRSPHYLFDVRYYRECNSDLGGSMVNPLVHYLRWGAYEGRDPHPHFDSSFYLERNSDVREMHLNPLAHYLAQGIVECRDPNPWFDASAYLERNPHICALGVDPLVHYLENAPPVR